MAKGINRKQALSYHSMHFRERSLPLQAWTWLLKTYAQKLRIRLEDRLGLYPYRRWIKEVETSSDLLVSPKTRDHPLVSDHLMLSVLIIPDEQNQHRLSRTLASLQAQNYAGWEYLSLTKDDPGRSLSATTGEFVLFANPGDILSLTCISKIAQTSNADIIYFDEDVWPDNSQARQSPFFKPDWSPDLLLSVNYLAHAAFRRPLLLECFQQSASLEEAILRCTERADRVIHIPNILYHGVSEPPLQCKFSRPALIAHLQRLGMSNVQTVEDSTGQMHFSWAHTDHRVSIVIPSKDRVGYLQRCVSSIQKITHYPNYEFVIVDNNSQQAETWQYYAQLKRASNVTIIEHQAPFNYSTYNNLGARRANGDLLLFLNNDIEATYPDWLAELVMWAEQPGVGAVGAKLRYPDGDLQHAGIVVGMEGHGNHIFAGMKEGAAGYSGSSDWYRNVSAVTGACLMMPRTVFEQIGGFDERYILVFNDIEICQRTLAHGYRIVYNPFAQLIHYEGKSRGHHNPPEDIHLGAEQLRDRVAGGDPFYNPNLSYAVHFPSLRRSWEENRLKRLEKITQIVSQKQ